MIINNEYDDFCKMLMCLTDEEQDLILSITENFLRVNSSEYFIYYKKAFAALASAITPVDGGRLFISPLLREEDINKTKSSTYLYYALKEHVPRLQMEYKQHKICLVDRATILCDPKYRVCEKDYICLIDDYIGTGETSCSAIQEVIEYGIIPTENIIVLALVGQKDGVAAIKAYVPNVFVAEVRARSISDVFADWEEKIRIMYNLEQRMKVEERFSLGYGRSEASVKMLRTPNNTFPIFWYNKSKTIKPVPFPRG